MKKTVEKTKTNINTSFRLCPGSIILKSLSLNTCCLGPKTVKKQATFIFCKFQQNVLLDLDLPTKVFPVI